MTLSVSVRLKTNQPTNQPTKQTNKQTNKRGITCLYGKITLGYEFSEAVFYCLPLLITIFYAFKCQCIVYVYLDNNRTILQFTYYLQCYSSLLVYLDSMQPGTLTTLF